MEEALIKLQPVLQKLKESISDPEARKMCERACAEVTKAAGDGSVALISDAKVLEHVSAECGVETTETVKLARVISIVGSETELESFGFCTFQIL